MKDLFEIFIFSGSHNIIIYNITVIINGNAGCGLRMLSMEGMMGMVVVPGSEGSQLGIIC